MGYRSLFTVAGFSFPLFFSLAAGGGSCFDFSLYSSGLLAFCWFRTRIFPRPNPLYSRRLFSNFLERCVDY
jgi:hypothetical protein